MATYSSAPSYDFVSFTKSVDDAGVGIVTTDFDLVTVPANTIYQPISLFGSCDNGGAAFTVQGIIEDGWVSVSGLSNTGDNNVSQKIYWLHNYIYSSSSYTWLKGNYNGPNSTQSWSDFYQIDHNDYAYSYRYMPGQKIQLSIIAYEANGSGEQVAARVDFLKITYP